VRTCTRGAAGVARSLGLGAQTALQPLHLERTASHESLPGLAGYPRVEHREWVKLAARERLVGARRGKQADLAIAADDAMDSDRKMAPSSPLSNPKAESLP